MKTVKRIPITEHHRALMAAPTIASQMPLIFANGTEFHKWSGCCAGCGKQTKSSKLTGTITRPIEAVAVMEAVGVCGSCNLLTPYHVRLRNNLSMESVIGGRWCKSDNQGTRPLETIFIERPKGGLLKELATSWGVFLVIMLPMIISLFKIARMCR